MQAHNIFWEALGNSPLSPFPLNSAQVPRNGHKITRRLNYLVVEIKHNRAQHCWCTLLVDTCIVFRYWFLFSTPVTMLYGQEIIAGGPFNPITALSPPFRRVQSPEVSYLNHGSYTTKHDTRKSYICAVIMYGHVIVIVLQGDNISPFTVYTTLYLYIYICTTS